MDVGRRLVITADDLGVDEAANAAIVDLLREGRVTASTLITVGPAAADALARARGAAVPEPRLHVTLTSARELPGWRAMADDVASLTDASGVLPVDAAALERRAEPGDVVLEMRAQLAWMQGHGVAPTVLDSHSGSLYGLHGGSLATAAVDFCAEQGLAFRLPRRLHRVAGLAIRGLGVRHRHAVTRADDLGVRLPQAMIGSWWPGALLAGYPHLRAHVLGQLRSLPAGVSELVMHPAPPTAVTAMPAGEARKRVWELRLLRDPAFWQELHRQRIDVVPDW